MPDNFSCTLTLNFLQARITLQILRKYWLLFFYLASSLFLSVAHVHAAEIHASEDPLCSFRLDGEIVSGDSEKLGALISKSKIDNLETMSLCLRSPGGSFGEALKISELLYSRGISTVITYGSECYSACAIIFMSGTMNDRIAPYRMLSAGGVLGFHAPYLSLPSDRYSKEQLDAATQGMRLAIVALLKLSSRQTQLAGNEFWKMSLVTGILERGPKEVQFVRTIADAARWNILIFDSKKYFPSPNSGDEIKNVCGNYHYANMDTLVPSDVDLSIKIERYSSRYIKDDFRVLVTDNKTHSKVCEIYPRTMKGSRDRIDFFVCSYDYWSSKSFGDCREYKTAAIFGKYAPHYFTLDPNLPLKSFTDAHRP